jgi:amino acid transporter
MPDPKFAETQLMESPAKATQPIAPQLGLWDAISIIIGIVIGTGIYKTPSIVFANVSGPWMGLGIWVLGGLLSLAGALCYAELASTYRYSGGDYVYLTRAFGPWMGFLFGWAQLVVVRGGNIGMMAYVFGDYAVGLFGLEPAATVIIAMLAVVGLTALNMLGVVFGKGTQNILTTAKVIGLGAIAVAGLSQGHVAPLNTPSKEVGLGPFGLALLLVLFTYGGWNDAALVASEQRNPRRNIPLALILGTSAITLIYLLVNGAYLLLLGFEGAQKSNTIAADALEVAWQETGKNGISVLVMVSALAAMNGMIFTGSRVYSSMGADYSLFAWLGRWNPRCGSPIWSLLVQMLLTLGLIALVGTEAGLAAIKQLLVWLRLQPLDWQVGQQGFERLVAVTSPAFWLFFLMTGISLFVLRQKDPYIERPFTVPFYPFLPLIFCDTCAYMLYRATVWVEEMALLSLAVVHVGLLFYWLSRKRVAPENGGFAESSIQY